MLLALRNPAIDGLLVASVAVPGAHAANVPLICLCAQPDIYGDDIYGDTSDAFAEVPPVKQPTQAAPAKVCGGLIAPGFQGCSFNHRHMKCGLTCTSPMSAQTAANSNASAPAVTARESELQVRPASLAHHCASAESPLQCFHVSDGLFAQYAGENIRIQRTMPSECI